MNQLFQDLRYGARMLAKNPGFTTVAVITLALGIGANTAIFTVVNAVLIRPLPYPDSERIVFLTWQSKDSYRTFTARQYEFCKQHGTTFQAIAAYRGGGDLKFEGAAAPEWFRAMRVTDGFFRVLGVNPSLGREFSADEARIGGPQAVVVSDGLWRRIFGGDPGIVGKPVRLNGQSFTVVGIAPRGFTFGGAESTEVFLPLRFGTGLEDRGTNTNVIARLKAGVSFAQAQAGMEALSRGFRTAHPDLVAVELDWRGFYLWPYQSWMARDIGDSLWLLFGAVGIVLLIACANVVSLLLARAVSRQREISIRRMLGAGHGRLLTQFFVESLLLALAGAAAALIAANWLLGTLVSSIPFEVPWKERIGLDAGALGFALLVAVCSGLVFGLVSFLQMVKLDPNAALKQRGAAGGPHRNRFRQALIVTEVGLSIMLLAGAGLLITSLYRLQLEKLGFDPQNVVTMSTPFSGGPQRGADAAWEFKRQVIERIKAIPGVVSVAAVTGLPLAGMNNLPVQREGHPEYSIGGTEYRAISPEYFAAMRIPLIRGRAFSESDTQSAPLVGIVNETLARAWWPGGNPIGGRVVVGMFKGQPVLKVAEAPREIVGIVGDVKGRALGAPPPPMLYVPAAQAESGWTSWVIRAQAPANLEAALRQAIRDIDPGQRVLAVRPMSEIVSASAARARFNTVLMATFAAIALLLAAVGLYGVIAYSVEQQTHEIGVRMALGARRGDVLRRVVGQGMTLALLGGVFGLAGALGFKRFLSGLLFGVRPADPMVLGAVAIILAALALVASYVPARRAIKVDPMVALRYE